MAKSVNVSQRILMACAARSSDMIVTANIRRWKYWQREEIAHCSPAHDGGSVMALAEVGAVTGKKNMVFWRK